MKIDPKDRSQLLRMAGNIACGIYAPFRTSDSIAREAAEIAVETMKEVDRLIAKDASHE